MTHQNSPASDGLSAQMAAFGMDRRSFITRTLLSIGVAGAALSGCSLLNGDEKDTGPFFDKGQMEILDAVSETIMPRTDTPGARDAKVAPRFDTLMQNWASKETQAEFTKVLSDIDAAAKGIVKLSPEKQLAAVSAFDMANMKNPAYIKFKGLILSLYYLSEPGATQELRYEHNPGTWEPSIAVTDDTRGYAVDVSFGGN